MADPTFIACPHCGEPVVMTAMQHELFRGRALACSKCAKQFTVDPQRTPLFTLSPTGRAYLTSPPPPPAGDQPAAAADGAPRRAPEPAPPDFAAAAAAKPRPRDDGPAAAWKLPAMVVGGFLLLAAILAVILLPPMRTARASKQQVNCAANLRQLGIALQVYVGNHGEYPDTLASLVSANQIRPDVLICPATDHTPAPGSTNQQQALNLKSGAHLSYVYLGRDLTPAAAAANAAAATASGVPGVPGGQTVLLYEPLSNHGASKGSHALLADGTIAFLTPTVVRQLIQSLPPGSSATAPAVVPSP